jgi:hypothetical protein
MGNSSKVIDYLDLRITVPEKLAELVEKWLVDFTDKHDFIELAPRFKEGILRINSTDFIAFLGYVNPEELSEFELHRFRSLAGNELDQLLLKSLSIDQQSHYKWCLAALSNFEIGRYLKDA